MKWEMYCRVVDNFGDIGVAWRLAADLAGRGERVELFVDDASALAWMAPQPVAGVTVSAWGGGGAGRADVVLELFGAGLPEPVADAVQPPLCINVEHLSAEAYVERSHGLPSPRRGRNGRTSTTWFFYPGFTAGTGGLLREPDLLARRADFGSGDAWLAARSIDLRDGERRVSLFAYANPQIDALLDALSRHPTLLLLAPCPATEQAVAALGPSLRRGGLRAVRLPLLSQPDFDRLLWSCGLNLVRGEDSLVRALWAGSPFLWQIYPQDDGVHARKLAAFLDRFLAGTEPALASGLRTLFAGWNGLGPSGKAYEVALEPDCLAGWQARCTAWRAGLATRPDLTSQLIEFARSKR